MTDAELMRLKKLCLFHRGLGAELGEIERHVPELIAEVQKLKREVRKLKRSYAGERNQREDRGNRKVS